MPLVTVHKYMDTASSSAGGTGNSSALTGADRAYRTLKEAITSLKAEYPDYRASAADVEIKLHLLASTGVVDSYNESLPITIESMIMDSTHGLEIFCDTPASMPWDTNRYILRQTNSFYTTIRVDALNVFIHDVQMENTGVSTNNAVMITTSLRSNATIRYERNHIRGAGATTSSNSMGINHTLPAGGVTGVTVYCNNNFFTGWGYGFRTGDLGSGITWNIAHNTSIDNRWNIAAFKGGTVRLYNNLMQGGKTADYLTGSSGGSYTTGNNITSDTSGPDAGFVSTTPTFAAAGDYHLDEADTEAKGQGTDLTADANNPVPLDFDGLTRTVPVSIGAFDFAAVTGQTLRPTATVSAGVWVNETGGSNLHASTSDDADATYAISPEPPAGDQGSVELGGGQMPDTGDWTSVIRVSLEP